MTTQREQHLKTFAGALIAGVAVPDHVAGSITDFPVSFQNICAVNAAFSTLNAVVIEDVPTRNF